ncbi:MAG: hypothetical protein MHM6MM_002026 [Cercozoa sp. M6MM]
MTVVALPRVFSADSVQSISDFLQTELTKPGAIPTETNVFLGKHAVHGRKFENSVSGLTLATCSENLLLQSDLTVSYKGEVTQVRELPSEELRELTCLALELVCRRGAISNAEHVDLVVKYVCDAHCFYRIGPPPEELKNHPQCPACRVYRQVCYCDATPKHLSSKTRVTLLVHNRELHLASNTASLLKRALSDQCRYLLRGLQHRPLHPSRFYGLGSPHSDSDNTGSDNDTDSNSVEFMPVLLFPTEDAIILDSRGVQRIHDMAQGRRIDLVVPDGTWRQAKKVRQRDKVLREITCVKLPSDGPVSRFAMRAEKDHTRVSTFEAVARALGALECPLLQQRLEEYFDAAQGALMKHRHGQQADLTDLARQRQQRAHGTAPSDH